MLEGITEGFWSWTTLRSDQVAQLHFEYLLRRRGHDLYVLVLVLTTLVMNNSSPKS